MGMGVRAGAAIIPNVQAPVNDVLHSRYVAL
jgi:hypothetical protein